MTPRRYRSTVRAEAAGRTRAAIVEAAIALYAKQGVVATSWEDLAREAGVSFATVYRHFPSLHDLIPACAQASFDVAHIPTPEEARARFASVNSVEARMKILVEETCHCYEDAERWLTAAYRDRDIVPAMAVVVDRQRTAGEALIRGALRRRSGATKAVSLVGALIDFPFWKSLRESNVAVSQIPQLVLELVMSSIGKGKG